MSRYDEMKHIADAELVRVARSVSRARTALETAERQQAALKKYWKRALEGARRADEAEKEKES